MKCVIVSCVFPPEPVVSSQTSASIAHALAARGDDVRVVTAFPNRPAGRVYPSFRRVLDHRELRGGIVVRRLPAATSARSTAVSRGWENLSFGVLSAVAILAGPAADVVYINSWPIIATGLAALAARLRGMPYVLSVQDLYPESLVTQSRRGWGILLRILLSLDAIISRGATAVIIITPRFAPAYLRRGVMPERLRIVRNWVTTSGRGEAREIQAMRRSLGVNTRDRLFAYGGNVGVAAGVGILVDAHQQLADPSAVLCIAGDGSELGSIKRRASAASRIVFRSPWATEETESLLGAADVLMLPTQGMQSVASVPSKLITYMLAGRPVLAAVTEDSETAYIIRHARCGWVVAPSDTSALVDKMRCVLGLSHHELDALGESGRHYALTNFTAEQCVPEVLGVLDDVSGPAAPDLAVGAGDHRDRLRDHSHV